MEKRLQAENTKQAVITSFVFAAALALFIFLPFLIVDKGFFLYCGDYNSQQIPFYVHVQQFIKDGGGTWDWGTDLGSSFINSYSFYNLGSPFLWLTLPFPSSWIPYMMVPLFMLKFGSIAAGACLYLRRYAKTATMPIVVSVVYAFCGFNVYNIFFNHMLEPVVFFPFLLWAMDGLILEKKTGWFALFVGLALLNSYFFFIGNVVFLLIYFIIQCLFGTYRFRLPAFLQLGFEAILGVGIGMALALPSVLSLMDNPRTDNFANGMNVILYWHVQQIPAILSSLIVPPDPPYLPNVFTEGAIKWTSMSAFLPLFSIAGVAAYFRSKRGGWLKIILLTSLVMALVPILNSSFFAFNASYYARWFYMPLLMMCLASLFALEDKQIDLAFGLKFTIVVTTLWGFMGLIPTETDDGATRIGLGQYTGKFWLTWGTAMLGIVAFALIWHFCRNKKQYASILLGAVMGFSVLYSVIHISLGKFPQWDGDQYYVEQQYEGSAQLEFPEDDQFYRIDTYNTYDNLGIWLNKSTLQTFHSVVTPSILEFYPNLGVKRDVSSKPEPEHYALRGLLSAKYTVVPLADRELFEAENPGSFGWEYLGAQGVFALYENENFVPLGFTYDAFIPMTTLESVQEEDRAPLLMRGIGLSPEQIAQYAHLFEQEIGFSNTVSYDAYVQDAAKLRENASSETSADASGFSVEITLDKENLVFFSVPYDPGFTATVDGEEAEILNVSGGMMAVYADAGTHEIVFTYKTPGFALGLGISAFCVLLLAGYWVYSRRVLKKRREEEGCETGLADEVQTSLSKPEKHRRGGRENVKETQEPKEVENHDKNKG